jgi:uncharacterized protein (TIGR00255 family)
VRATVDVRSVNHRFIDLKLRAQVSPALEDAIAAKIKATVERGAITVSLHLDKPRGASAIRIDVARAAHAELVALAHELEIAEPDLALVLAQPGVIAAQDAGEPDAAVMAALEAALAQLAEMRASEGRALATELGTRLDELAQLRAKIDAIAGHVPEQLQKRLHERLRRLLGDDSASVDATRIAQEVALLAERADVTEELVRLGSHLEQARVLVGGRAAAGRRLEFLVQEIGRELNTIGSKSQDAEITSHVVEAKAILEKLREQVQNVE